MKTYTKTTLQMVSEWNDKFGNEDNRKYGLTLAGVREELDELRDAIAAGDRVAVIDALTDAQYFLDHSFLSSRIEKMQEAAPTGRVKDASNVIAHAHRESEQVAKALAVKDEFGAGVMMNYLQYLLNVLYAHFDLLQHKQRAFEEVHRSNMSKLGENGEVLRRADGKVLKGPNWSPPNLRFVLGGSLVAGDRVKFVSCSHSSARVGDVGTVEGPANAFPGDEGLAVRLDKNGAVVYAEVSNLQLQEKGYQP